MTSSDGDPSRSPFPRSNRAFLEAIFGAEDWKRVHVTGFPGDPAKGGSWGGTLAGGWMPDERDNTYFCVSLFHGHQRQAPLLDRWVLLGVDDVGTDKVKAADVLSLLGEPMYRIETSPGNEHWGYRLGGPPITDHVWANAFIKALIRKLVGDAGHDPGMRDVTRYLRLPYGRNHKEVCGPGGFAVRGTHWEPDRELVLDERICAALGVSPCPPDGLPGSKPPASFEQPASAAVDDALAEQDLLFQAMRRLGLVIGGPRNMAMGRGYDLICPWVHEHTDRATTGTAYVPILQRFQCQHGHCVDRTGADLQARIDELLREDSGGLIGAGDIEFDTVDPATVELPDVLMSEAERKFFARYVYLRPRDAFWDIDRQVLVRDRDLNSGWTQPLRAVLPRVGEGRRAHPMPPASWFLGDKRGRRVEGEIWWPDQPEIVTRDRQRLVNRWTPLPRPLKGMPVDDTTVRPWRDLFWHVVGHATPDEYALGETILDWMAMTLATNIKGGWQVLITSQTHGIGKEMIVQPITHALDKRGKTVQADEMNGGFSEWMDKRLVLLSDVRQTTRGTTSPHDQMAKLKNVFDRGKEWMTINPKYAPHYEARNVLMGWLTSNEDNPLRLEEGDRRFLVLDRRCVERQAPEVYAALGRWFTGANGFALVAEWLFRRWDSMGDTRRAVLTGTAPMTDAKRVMIAENEDPTDVLLRTWIESLPPDVDALPDVVSTDEVVRRLISAQRDGRLGGARPNLNPQSVGLRLSRLGAVKLHKGAQVRVEGRLVRVWSVRNDALYEPLNPTELAKICNKIGTTQPNLSHH